jgi:CDP-diacylglycerol--serine O-phosphatidyltransferase
MKPHRAATREHRRRRIRRHGRRAYIRSVYFLPSLATLGNAVCGFGAMYVASLAASAHESGHGSFVYRDPFVRFFANSAFANGFVFAAYLIFLAMVFDALDGRLARFTRHTTDFGGQLDSLADVVSFGAAPAFIALQLFRVEVLDVRDVPFVLARLNWAIGALYFSCAALRLARFNVSNEHGEQHHFSFLGLPSPGAGGAVAAWILMQQDLRWHGTVGGIGIARALADACIYALPVMVLATGLLMVSDIRYPHIVNRYLRGKRSLARLLFAVVLLLLLVVWHQYTLGIGMMLYAFYGFANFLFSRIRKAHPTVLPSAPPSP